MLRLDRNRATRFPIFFGSLAGEVGGTPGRCERPAALGCPERELHRFGRFAQVHHGEEPQFHKLGGFGVRTGQAVDRVIQREEIAVYERQEVRRGLRISVVDGAKNAGDLIHEDKHNWRGDGPQRRGGNCEVKRSRRGGEHFGAILG